MPSPFPGMDPFIESQEWNDFHTTAITVIRELLRPQFGKRYAVRVERRVYSECPRVNETSYEAFDGEIAEPSSRVTCLLPMPLEPHRRPAPEEHREAYLVIREQKTGEPVTVIEFLSPSNKRLETDGRREYLQNRWENLKYEVHLVEIDLLRGGTRMPIRPRVPVTGEYVTLVSRFHMRPKAELYVWSLRQRLPTVAIPRAKDDSDVSLDLQSVLNTVYDRANYDRTLDYSRPLDPAADDATEKWLVDVLGEKRRPASQTK